MAKFLSIFMGLICLAACQTTNSTSPAQTAQATTQPTPSNIPVIAKVETPLVVEEAQAVHNTAHLRGLTPQKIQILLGKPSLIRHDDNVQMMLFENHTCVFEVIFYKTVPSSSFTAKATNARTTNGTETNKDKCLAHILPNKQSLDQG